MPRARIMPARLGWLPPAAGSAALAGLAYYAGARLGFALTPRAHPVSTLWPPNAILMAALALAPAAAWPFALVGVLVAHLVVELQANIPLPLIAGWFISNTAESLIGAVAIRRLIGFPPRLDSVRRVGIFVAFAALLAPFLSSFLDAAFVGLNGWGDASYGDVWTARFFSNVLATLALVPALVIWGTEGRAILRSISRARALEALLLAASLLVVCAVVFAPTSWSADPTPAWLYAPLPLLLWAAVRFGPAGTSAALFVFAWISIWGALNDRGPFAVGGIAQPVLSLQLFLIVTSVPLLALAAVISERGRAEDEARRTADQLNMALSAANVGTWEWDIASGRSTWSGRMGEVLGLSEDTTAVDLRSFMELIVPDDRPTLEAAVTRAVDFGEPFEAEYRVAASDGSVRWIVTKGTVVRDGAGHPARMIGVNADMTELRIAESLRREEAELRASEAQLRALGEKLEQRVVERTAELSRANAALREEIQVRLRIESELRATEERFAKAFGAGPDAVAIMQQADSRTIEVNRRWEHLFRCRREDVIGRPLDELALFADQQDALCVSELIATQGSINELELDLRRHDGALFRAVITAERVEMGGEPCIIVAIRDITDQRRAEYEIAAQRRQLAHLGRVALLGELSGALAHELNQPLAAILANARAAQRLLAHESFDAAEVRTILDDIVADDRRAGAVISRVRAMIRKSEAEMHQISVNDIVVEVLDLARSDLRQRGVAINSRWSAALPLVRADRVQLQQVVLNLIVNASDAMMELPPSERMILVVTSADGDAVRIAVADRGVGIAPDALEAVFEPFVTSKSHGLGLGLSICRSIVDAHGGRLWATNNDDRGATFHVRLPAATEMITAVPA